MIDTLKSTLDELLGEDNTENLPTKMLMIEGVKEYFLNGSNYVYDDSTLSKLHRELLFALTSDDFSWDTTWFFNLIGKMDEARGNLKMAMDNYMAVFNSFPGRHFVCFGVVRILLMLNKKEEAFTILKEIGGYEMCKNSKSFKNPDSIIAGLISHFKLNLPDDSLLKEYNVEEVCKGFYSILAGNHTVVELA